MATESKKVTELPTTNTASNNDVLYIVRDPSGTPASRKITVQNLLKDPTASAANAYTNAVAVATSLAGNAYTNSVAAATSLSGNAYTNAVAAATSLAANAYTNAVAYVVNSTSMLTPNIAYTGTFVGYPPVLEIYKNQTIYFTGNNTVLETPNKYWLKTFQSGPSFGEYNLSATTSLNFVNIGGIDTFTMTSNVHNLITSLNFPSVAAITNTFTLNSGFANLTSCNASSLIYAKEIVIDGTQKSNTQFNFSNLKFAKAISIVNHSVLTVAPQFPALQEIVTLDIGYNSATNDTFVFSNLLKAMAIDVYNNTAQLITEFPLLTETSGISFDGNANMVVPPTFPVLTTVRGNFQFGAHTSITVAPATPSLVTVLGDILMDSNSSMVNGLDFTSLKRVNGDVLFNDCALNQTSVDYILTKLASLDGTNGTTSYNNNVVDLSSGTNAVPSATGLAAIAILEGRGCTVYHNT